MPDALALRFRHAIWVNQHFATAALGPLPIAGDRLQNISATTEIWAKPVPVPPGHTGKAAVAGVLFNRGQQPARITLDFGLLGGSFGGSDATIFDVIAGKDIAGTATGKYSSGVIESHGCEFVVAVFPDSLAPHGAPSRLRVPGKADDDLVLVGAGRRATIVVGPSRPTQLPTPCPGHPILDNSTGQAALNLQTHIAMASNVTLEIVDEGRAASVPSPKVYIGHVKQLAALGLDNASLGMEGYRVVAHGGDLFVVGDDICTGVEHTHWSQCRQGTKFGVTALLRDLLGVRWPHAGASGTRVPASDTISVPADTNLSSAPALRGRTLGGTHSISLSGCLIERLALFL